MRDFLYIEDAARAFVSLLDSVVTGAVNIASGKGISVRDLVEAISKKTGNDNRVQYGARPTNASEPPELVADISRLTDEAVWQPQYSMDQSLNLTVQWWKSVLSKEPL